MQTKIAVNGILFSYVEKELHYKNAYGSYTKELFENYKQYCFEQSVAPQSYKKYRESLKEILEKEMPEAELTKKNNRYYVLNVIRELKI